MWNEMKRKLCEWRQQIFLRFPSEFHFDKEIEWNKKEKWKVEKIIEIEEEKKKVQVEGEVWELFHRESF